MTELRGWHVLLMLSAFFGVMIAVNVVFMTYAYDTFTGEDTSSPYLKGLQFNKTLDERAVQAKLGWHATIELNPDGNGVIPAATIRDAAGAPQDSLRVTMTLRRPTNAALDRELPLTAIGNGRYTAAVLPLAPGQWDVTVRAELAGGVTFEANRRVLLP